MKKKLLGILMAISILVCISTIMSVSVNASFYPFNDVPEWADPYVNSVYMKGIMKGTSDTAFDSYGALTREQLAVTLYRLSGSRQTGDFKSLKDTFADAEDISKWAYDAVSWAYSVGITSGITQGEAICFKPQDYVTRQEAAKFFVTYIDYMELVAPTDNTAELNDLDTVADWARPYVDRCIAAGIINGDGNGNFDPSGVTVRVAAAKMLDCLPTGKNSKMIAHRGYSYAEKENTIPAFIAAGQRSYYGIEADVWVTADNEFVIIHNATTEAVTNGLYNLDVRESTWKQLSAVRIPDIDGTLNRDIRLPRLEDYIGICKQYEKVPILELKGSYTTKQLELMIEKIDSVGYLNETTFISFSWDLCVEIRRLLPENQIQWLTEETFRDEFVDMLSEYMIDLSINHKCIDKANVELLHLNGIKLGCWTCDDSKKAELLRDWGVDFITTNWLE